MTKAFDDKARWEMINNYTSFEYDGTPIKEMSVIPCSASFARPYIATFHYSKTMPDSTLYAFAGYLNGELCGIVCYGMGAGKNQYTALIPDIKNGEYIELTRLWCPDCMPKNTESKLIAESLKLLPKEIKLVLSFSDTSKNHCGTIYQATNWLYCGCNNGGKMLVTADGIEKHPRLIGIYRKRHPELKDKSSQEIMDLLGFTYTMGGRKNRYVFLRGSKKQKRAMYKQIESFIQPYPEKLNKTDCKTEEEIITESADSILNSGGVIQLAL